jgi:hypothetical protein
LEVHDTRLERHELLADRVGVLAQVGARAAEEVDVGHRRVAAGALELEDRPRLLVPDATGVLFVLLEVGREDRVIDQSGTARHHQQRHRTHREADEIEAADEGLEHRLAGRQSCSRLAGANDEHGLRP